MKSIVIFTDNNNEWNFVTNFHNQFSASIEEAMTWYEKVPEIDPKDTDALFGKGNGLYSLDKYEEAITWYDKVLAIDPKDVDALNNKANALAELDKK